MPEKSESVTIPRWFLNISSLIMMGAIPWAFHTSIKLNTLTVKLESTIELKKKFESHRDHHVSEEQILEIKRRLEKLEGR